MADDVVRRMMPKEIDESRSFELLHLGRNSMLRGVPSGDARCGVCRYYLDDSADVSYCWHPRLRILVGAQWWCQWWETNQDEDDEVDEG